MRVQCDVCERSEAAVVCCADEAALCAACDAKVHAANKLAGKHQRIPLISPSTSQPTLCDICQEKTGWFFCLEDRALLCRGCDVSIHSVNALSSAHKRFLITGVKIGLKPLSADDFLVAPPPKDESVEIDRSSTGTWSPASVKKRAAEAEVYPDTSSSISEYLTESVPGWRVDELLNIPELGGGYTLGDVGSSKADVGTLGEFDWMADLSLFDEQHYVDTLHEVPEMGGGYHAKMVTTKGKQSVTMVSQSEELLLVPELGLKRRRLRE